MTVRERAVRREEAPHMGVLVVGVDASMDARSGLASAPARPQPCAATDLPYTIYWRRRRFLKIILVGISFYSKFFHSFFATNLFNQL